MSEPTHIVSRRLAVGEYDGRDVLVVLRTRLDWRPTLFSRPPSTAAG